MSNLNELEQKTEILKKEIIEKNYDQNGFINYCLLKKENAKFKKENELLKKKNKKYKKKNKKLKIKNEKIIKKNKIIKK